MACLAIFAGLAMAEENSFHAPEIETISPIIKDIPEKDLRQELSIKENRGKGKVVCLALDICPSASVQADEVLIKAAKVTEMGSGFLKISIFGYVYKIDISGSKIVRYGWNESMIDEFSVGDIVNVHGYLDANDNYLIHAKTVRNVSIQNIHGVFSGAIESINATSTVFTMATEKNGSQTVVVNGDTKIFKQTEIVCIMAPCFPIYTAGLFSDLQIGAKVTVRGIWNKASSKIQARVVMIGNLSFLLKEKGEKIFNKEKWQKEEYKEKEWKEEYKEIKKDDNEGMMFKILDIQNQLKGLMEKIDKIKKE